MLRAFVLDVLHGSHESASHEVTWKGFPRPVAMPSYAFTAMARYLLFSRSYVCMSYIPPRVALKTKEYSKAKTLDSDLILPHDHT